MDPSRTDLFRLISGNINGLSLDNTTQIKTQEILTNLHSLNSSAYLFQEINTDFKQREAQEKFSRAMNTFYPNNFYIASNSSVYAPTSTWLPGGTMSALLHRWTGAKMASGIDYPLGRWSWISLQGRQDKIITLISAYRVNPGRSSMGSLSTYKQQYHILLQEDVESPDPRTQTIQDLQAFILQRLDQKEEIILSIDANEVSDSHKSPPNSISSLITSLGLIDLSTTLPETFESHKGGRLIDFCLISPNLLPAVEAFGYLPYDQITSTDHRLTFLDLNIQELFNHKPDPPMIHSSRILKTHLIQRKHKYINIITEHFKKQNLLRAAQNLQKEAIALGHWTENLQRKYENIDSQATTMMLKTEQKCTPHFPSLVTWSTKLRTQGLILRYFNKYKRFLSGHNIQVHTLHKLANQAGIQHEVFSISQLLHKRNEAQLLLRKIKKNHEQVRRQFLQSLYDEYAQEDNHKAQQIVSTIIEREHVKKIHRNIRQALGKGRNTSLLRLIVPSSTDTKISTIYTSKHDIHEKIIDQNIAHYSKAENSPLGIGTPLYKKIGPHGTSPFCDRVLQGQLNFQDMQDIPMQETLELLQATLYPPSTSPSSSSGTTISIDLNHDDYTKIFSKWAEKTTTSPSGRHLGHYKAILQSPELIQYHCIMSSLPLQFGFAPERWTKAFQIMLEKKPGNPLIHRLRGIIILEADFNWVLRLIWGKRLFQRASASNFLMNAQQAKPGNQSITAALNKVLAYDILRVTKRQGGSFDNDAEGCYDRIVPPHAMICCRRMGLPKSSATMLTQILQNTVYKLKTGHGPSAKVYLSNQTRRILGTGQGSGASPCIWTLVLDTILWAVANKYKCFNIQSPSGIQINRVGDAFVDDTSIFYINNADPEIHPFSTHEIAHHLELIAQDFERKLHSTGGNLSLPKCFWYLVNWVWNEEGTATMTKISHSPANIHLTQGSFSDKYKIKREEIDTSIRTIGVRVNPLGQTDTEYHFRLQYTQQWTSMIKTSKLTPEEVIRAYRNVYIPSISYPLGAVYFTPEQCETLQNLAGQAYISKLGFNRKLPKDIFFGPSKFGGWGEKDLYFHMAALQTKLFLGHVRNQDETGSLLLTDLEFTQVHSGLEHSILHPKTSLHFLIWTEKTWMTDYKQILHHTQGEIKIDHQWLPSKQRKHDRFLMHAFSHHITDRALLKILNNCRLYLQIFTLSDITSGDGRSILKHPLFGQKSPHFSSAINWPVQSKPSSATWKIFSSTVKKIFCVPNSNKLLRPLGPWRKTKFKQTIWKHFYDPITNRLYKRYDRKYNPWTFHRPITNNKLIFNSSPGMPHTPPTPIHRITLNSQSPNTWIYTSPSSFPFTSIAQAEIYSHPQSPSPSTTPPCLPSDPYFTIPTHLACDLSTSKYIETATDGSVSKGTMTASWAIQLKSKIFKSGGKIPGGSSHPSSTRAERGAYLHLLINIYKLTTQFSLSHKTVHTYIDNMQVIDYSTLPTKGSGPTGFIIEDYDLLDGIRFYTEVLQNKFHIHFHQIHIYSHLDDKQKQNRIVQKHGSEHLNLHLQNQTARSLNQTCDTEASLHHNDTVSLITPTIPNQINVFFQGHLHTSKNFHYLHDIQQEHRYKTYLQEKFKWTDKTLDLIDWNVIEHYMKTLSISQKVKYIKLAHKWRPTHSKLFQTSNGTTQPPECPLCGDDKEDDDHPYTCTNPVMQDAHKEALQKLKKTLKNFGTYPLLIEVISHYLKHHMKGLQTDYTHRLIESIPIHKSLLKNIQDQTQIGWVHLLRGKIAKSWSDSQKLYNPRKNIDYWKKKLITSLIHTSETIWEIRNLLNFGSTETKMTNKQKQLQPYITTLYTHYRTTTLHTHHHLFNTPLQLRLKFSPQENQQWISTVKIAMRLYKKRQKQFFKTHTKITKYITTRKRTTQERDQAPPTQENQHRNKLRKTKQTCIGTFLLPRDPPNDAPT